MDHTKTPFDYHLISWKPLTMPSLSLYIHEHIYKYIYTYTNVYMYIYVHIHDIRTPQMSMSTNLENVTDKHLAFTLGRL